MTSKVQSSLYALLSAPAFLQQIETCTGAISESASEPDLCDALLTFNSLIGCVGSMFVSLLRDNESHESHRFVLACNPVWCLEYEQHGWFGDDAWLIHASSASEAVCDSALNMPARRKLASSYLAEQGVRSTLIMPVHSGAGLTRTGCLLLFSDVAGYFEDHLGVVKIAARGVAAELHEWWIRTERKRLLTASGLTDDDLTLLRLEAAGTSTERAADQLGRTASGLNSRWQIINQRLGTANRKHSAKLAKNYHLI